jgi:tetratricopeptide (TPR) repeat protein
MNNSAFISYRRDVSAFMARAIFQDLRSNSYDVFMDVESIDSGQFDTILLNQIAARPYFLLVLTPGTLDRCNEPGDWLRREIEHAMDLNRVIIPLTTPNFDFAPAQPFLTGKLADLPRFNGVNIPHDYFEEAMERLRKRFLKSVELNITPIPVEEQPVVQHKIQQAAAEPEVTEQQLSAQDYFERALTRAQDDPDGKIADYTQAISLDPQFGYAYLNRGIVYSKKHAYDAARADFSEAIRLDPKSDRAFFERALVQADIDDAIADYSQAIKHNPRHATALVRRGFDYKTKGDLERALADLELALEIQPNHPLAPIVQNYVNRYKEEQG